MSQMAFSKRPVILQYHAINTFYYEMMFILFCSNYKQIDQIIALWSKMAPPQGDHFLHDSHGVKL